MDAVPLAGKMGEGPLEAGTSREMGPFLEIPEGTGLPTLSLGETDFGRLDSGVVEKKRVWSGPPPSVAIYQETISQKSSRSPKHKHGVFGCDVLSGRRSKAEGSQRHKLTISESELTKNKSEQK